MNRPTDTPSRRPAHSGRRRDDVLHVWRTWRVAHGAAWSVALLACTLVARVALAQDLPARPNDEPVAANGAPTPSPPRAPVAGPVVTVVLDPPIAGEDPWARVGLHRGDPIDLAAARRALDRALGSGTFADARAMLRRVQGGVALIIQGERRIHVREVAFVGANERPTQAVREDFGIANGDWSTDAEVEQAVGRLRDGYQAAGWARATVSARWRETDDPDVRVLIVDVREGRATRVRQVVLEGVPESAAEAVRGALGLASGDIADPEVARRAVEPIAVEIRRAGYYTSVLQPVRFAPVGPALVDVVVHVDAGLHYRLAWEGVSPYPTTALETALHLEEERTLDVTTVSALVGRTRDFFVRRGFLDCTVRVGIEPENQGEAVLRFVVTRGRAVTVHSVAFVGAQGLPASELVEVLHEYLQNELPIGEFAVPVTLPAHDEVHNEHPVGELSGGPAFLWVYPERTYVPDLYVEAGRRVVSRYHERGFREAAVSPPRIDRITLADGSPGVDITYTVTEGPRTFLDEVEFEGNESFASATLADQLDLRLGVPLSYAALDTARVALVDYYREQGRLFVRADYVVDPSPDHTRARVRFEIHEGPEVRIGQIVVRGNSRTDEWVIRQRIDLRSGDLYRPSLVRSTQRRLGELGIFSGVTLTPIDPDVEAPVKDVLVQVLEARPQYIELRAGFSTGEGLRAGIDYGYRNVQIAGLTLAATLSAQLGYQLFIPINDPVYIQNYNSLSVGGRLRHRIALSFLMPAIKPLGPNWRGSIDLASARIIERQFALETSSVGSSLTFRPVRQYTVTLTPEFQVNSLALLGVMNVEQLLEETISNTFYGSGSGNADRLARLLLLPSGTTELASLRLTGAIDFRDQVFNPTRGVFAAATIEYVHTIGYQPSESDQTNAATMQPQPGDTLHTIGSISGYVPLHFLGIVLATNFRAGINIHLDSGTDAACRVTYTNRLFFLGGTDSMRGWFQDTMVPQDVLDAYTRVRPLNDPCTSQAVVQPQLSPDVIQLTQRGGDVFVNWRNELRIPIATTGFALGLFLELGNLWKYVQDVSLTLRADWGVGLRYISPIGPVAFDVGFIIDPTAVDTPTWQPNFSIGIF